jgi:hypothetical protein
VFISKVNKYPKDSSTAEWYCQKEGSETCIINKNNIEVGDTLYIGVKCLKHCSYKLKVYNIKETLLEESKRTQIRFDDFST